MFDNRNGYTTKEYLRNKYIFKIIKVIIFASYFYFFIFLINGLAENINNIFGIFFISGLIFLALKVVNYLDRQNVGDRKRNHSTWGKGAGAEGVVGNQLKQLGPEYKIIFDFQNGHGNIDFIVIGPKGIFTIEVKSQQGIIKCQNNWIYINNQKTKDNMLSQAWAEMNWLANYLKNVGLNFPITGILEFPYGEVDTNYIHGKIDNIWVGGSRFHEYVISRSQNNLSIEQINLVEKTLKNFTVSSVAEY